MALPYRYTILTLNGFFSFSILTTCPPDRGLPDFRLFVGLFSQFVIISLFLFLSIPASITPQLLLSTLFSEILNFSAPGKVRGQIIPRLKFLQFDWRNRDINIQIFFVPMKRRLKVTVCQKTKEIFIKPNLFFAS